MHGFPASASHLHLCVLSDPHSVPISRSGAHAFFSSFQSLFAEPRSTKKSSHLNRCLRVLHGIPNMAGLCNPPPPQVVLLKLSSAHAEQRAKKRNRCDFRLALGFGSLLFAIFSMQLACECRKFERSQVDEWLGWLGYASVRRRCETISRCLIRHLCWSSANEKIRCTLFFSIIFFLAGDQRHPELTVFES